MSSITAGLHHITAIASSPRANLAFYRDVLGLRLVKKTVNFDDPGTYHLYYGDGDGAPGTILTFFPWPDARRGRAGPGQAVEIAFAIPAASFAYWAKRLIDMGVDHDAPEKRFGESILSLRDPDGMHLELVASDEACQGTGWTAGPVPAEHAIRGFAGQTIWTQGDVTAKVLTAAFGYRKTGRDGNITRYQATGGAALARRIDLKDASGFMRGSPGAGTIHHIAFRAESDTAQAGMAGRLGALGLRPTEQLDRNYFRSIYVREPGGVLFEIATDDPGFAADEPAARLGETLKLPAWLESRREAIEAVLPALD